MSIFERLHCQTDWTCGFLTYVEIYDLIRLELAIITDIKLNDLIKLYFNSNNTKYKIRLRSQPSYSLFHGIQWISSYYIHDLSAKKCNYLHNRAMKWINQRSIQIHNITCHGECIINKKLLLQFPSLRSVNTRNIEVTDYAIRLLDETYPHIKFIYPFQRDAIFNTMSGNELNQYDIDNLPSFCKLSDALYLPNNTNPEGLRKIVSLSPHIKDLLFDTCQSITNDELNLLFKSLTIRKIDVDDMNDTSTLSVYLSKPNVGFKNITTITLRHVLKGDEVLCNLARCCPKLQHLKLSNISMTDKSLKEISCYCKYIKTIQLSHNDNNEITDEGLIAITKANNRLRRLELTSLNKITDEALKSLIENNQELRHLILNYMNFSNKEIENVSKNIPRIVDVIEKRRNVFINPFLNFFFATGIFV